MPRRSIGDPDFVYKPWTAEQRERRSKQMRAKWLAKQNPAAPLSPEHFAAFVNVTRTVGPTVKRANAKAIIIARRVVPKLKWTKPILIELRAWKTPTLREMAVIRRTRSWAGCHILWLEGDADDFVLNDPRSLAGIHIGLELFEFHRPHKLTPGWYTIERVSKTEIMVMSMDMHDCNYEAPAYAPGVRPT